MDKDGRSTGKRWTKLQGSLAPDGARTRDLGIKSPTQ